MSPDGGKAQKRERCAIEVLPILGESAAAVEPRQRALNDPALGILCYCSFLFCSFHPVMADTAIGTAGLGVAARSSEVAST